MRDILDSVGVASIRSQIGIEDEDPTVFRPYEVSEILQCAKILVTDDRTPQAVRRLLRVGLCYDLRAGHLSPLPDALAVTLGISARRVRAARLRWECVAPALRFDLCARSVGMILCWRGQAASRS